MLDELFNNQYDIYIEIALNNSDFSNFMIKNNKLIY